MAEKNNKKKEQEEITPTEGFIRDLGQRIKSGYSAIFVRTFEESRAMKAIKKCCEELKPKENVYFWDCMVANPETGATAIRLYKESTQESSKDEEEHSLAEVPAIFALLPTYVYGNFENRSVLVVKDFHYHLNDQPMVIRSIKNNLEVMSRKGKLVIFLGSQFTIPNELEKDIAILDFSLPGLKEISEVLSFALKSADVGSPDKKVIVTDEIKSKLCEAALGLTSQEALDLFSLTLAKNYKICEQSIKTVLDGKCEVIKRDGVLEYFSPDITINDVGGLQVIKEWLLKRIEIFTPEARDWGLPYPKGILMVGIQGCGKSLIAKMIANLYQIPLLRLDMGKVFQKYMGQSEGFSRRALMIAEAVAPCVLWIDEIEKGFSGTKSSGETDSGVTNRVISTFLTWMQEKTSPVFIAATGNNVTQLPPELMRKGRMDEIFFIDLPNDDERREIIKIHIAKRPKKMNKEIIPRIIENGGIEKIVKASKGYTGSEIEQAVINGLFDTFKSRRDLTVEDIITAFKDMVPLAKTMEEDITALRKWGEGRAKSASKQGKYVPEDINDESPFRRVVTQ